MADAGNLIFNKKATDKLRNPDDLDKFVRVTNPSVWVVLAACAILLAGLLCWGFLGAVTTSVKDTGVALNGKAICFLDTENAAKVHVGDSANVAGQEMTVESVSSIPYSREETRKILGNDYLESTLVEKDWEYLITFSGGSDLNQGVPLTVDITVQRIAPISLVLKNWG